MPNDTFETAYRKIIDFIKNKLKPTYVVQLPKNKDGLIVDNKDGELIYTSKEIKEMLAKNIMNDRVIVYNGNVKINNSLKDEENIINELKELFLKRTKVESKSVSTESIDRGEQFYSKLYPEYKFNIFVVKYNFKEYYFITYRDVLNKLCSPELLDIKLTKKWVNAIWYRCINGHNFDSDKELDKYLNELVESYKIEH